MISYVNPFRFIRNQLIGFSVYHIVFFVVSYRFVHSSFCSCACHYYLYVITCYLLQELIKQQLLFNLEFCEKSLVHFLLTEGYRETQLIINLN